VPHISLVFREMWDTTMLDAQLYRLSLSGPERSAVERSAVFFEVLIQKGYLSQLALGLGVGFLAVGFGGMLAVARNPQRG
jgi:hypothetical protein